MEEGRQGMSNQNDIPPQDSNKSKPPLKALAALFSRLWRWLRDNGRPIARFVLVLVLIFGLKRGLLDRFQSLTNIEELI
jgi:hypothetical protein